VKDDQRGFYDSGKNMKETVEQVIVAIASSADDSEERKKFLFSLT